MRVLAAILIILGALAAHFYAMHTGIYAAELREGFVWFDNVLHAFVGLAFGLLWISLVQRVRPETSFVASAVSLLLFVLSVAIAWEVFEYGFYLVFKSGALGLTVYEPSLQESIYDSMSNIAGAVLLLAAWLALRQRGASATAE
jgi:hypothetical protein